MKQQRQKFGAKNHKTELLMAQAIWQNFSARSTIHIAMCLKHFPGSVLPLNLLAQRLKVCFAHTEGKKLAWPA